MTDFRSRAEIARERQREAVEAQNWRQAFEAYKPLHDALDARMEAIERQLADIDARLAQTPTVTQIDTAMERIREAWNLANEDRETLRQLFSTVQQQNAALIDGNRGQTPATEDKIAQLAGLLKALKNDG